MFSSSYQARGQLSLTVLSFLVIVVFSTSVQALQNLFPKNIQDILPSPTSFTTAGSLSSPLASLTAKKIENELLQCIAELGENRLVNSEKIQDLVVQLESTPSIPQPAINDVIYGRWKLLHTDNANTASPIQRKAVDASKFPIYQDIVFNDAGQLIVSQVVKFNENAELKVDALASTTAYPLPELTERKGDGKILGLNILGVSKLGEEAKPPNKDSRIDFVFDEGKFQFGNNFEIPYPVPFRLPILRDTVKGWIDITYMSEQLRISRGNKGTTFVLLKEEQRGTMNNSGT